MVVILDIADLKKPGGNNVISWTVGFKAGSLNPDHLHIAD